MAKQMSRFAMPRGAKEPTAKSQAGVMTRQCQYFEDPRVERAMMELDAIWSIWTRTIRVTGTTKKMKDLMPPGTAPKELDVAIKRLEAGEDPEKIEQDMGEVLGDFMGGEEGGSGEGYTHDSGLYDYEAQHVLLRGCSPLAVIIAVMLWSASIL